jgi:cytoskeletal protein CcmA (bactofilin family)
MWNKNKKGTDLSVDALATRPTGCLPSSLHVKGNVTATEDLLIEGSVEGLIQLDERTVTIAPTAKLKADIQARDVVVYGYLKGNVRAKGRIEIKKDGAAIGSLAAPKITIEDGADFKGSLEIEKGPAEETNVAARARTAVAGPNSV